MIKMQENLMRPAFNIEGKSHLFNGGPLDKKVVRVPHGVDVYKFLKGNHHHTYRVYAAGAFYQGSEPVN